MKEGGGGESDGTFKATMVVQYPLPIIIFYVKKNSFFYLTKVFLFFVKPVLNWANISFAEYILEYLSNRTLFLN